MTTKEKLAWSTGAIAGTGLVVYSILLLTGLFRAAPVFWLPAAVCVAILAAYVVVMRDHTPDTDQQDAWVLGRAYRGQHVSKQMLLPVGGMALSIIFLQVGFLALASAMFSGVLAPMLLLSINELMYFNRQHEAPRISPAKCRVRPNRRRTNRCVSRPIIICQKFFTFDRGSPRFFVKGC